MVSSTLLEWCKTQDWWQYVYPLIASGLYVSLHVETEWPVGKDTLFHRASGGVLELTRCGTTGWHMNLVARPADMRAMVARAQDESPFRPRDRRHGWAHPVAGDA